MRDRIAALRALCAAGLGIFALGGCRLLFPGDEPLLRAFPDAVLEIPTPEGIPEDVLDTQAVDINESGTVVGYTDASGPIPSYEDYLNDYHIIGFAIQSDETGYTDVSATAAGTVASWPLSINDSGTIVGAYTIDLGGSYATHAYSINADGTGFVDLHPSGVDYSKATHINDNGQIFGETDNVDGVHTKAVMFTVSGGTATATELAPSYTFTTVQAVSNAYVVLSGYSSDSERWVLLLYEIGTGNVSVLSIGGVDSDTATVEEIRDDGRMAGWYTVLDSADYVGDVAFTYTLGDGAATLLNETNTIGKWDYVEYRFYDFTENGMLVGIGYRVDSPYAFPQARAIRINSDFTGFEDITPPNGGAYSEVYAITEDGTTVGYAGFSFADFLGRYVTTQNRAIVVNASGS